MLGPIDLGCLSRKSEQITLLALATGEKGRYLSASRQQLLPTNASDCGLQTASFAKVFRDFRRRKRLTEAAVS